MKIYLHATYSCTIWVLDIHGALKDTSLVSVQIVVLS